MQTEKQKMIALLVKEKRTGLNYTQQELADLCKVSLRSIQRIENGEVYPRQYTLNELSKNLNFSLDLLNPKTENSTKNSHASLPKKRIISLAIITGAALLSGAFIAQSSTFPETQFELYVFLFGVLMVISFSLFFLWRKNS